MNFIFYFFRMTSEVTLKQRLSNKDLLERMGIDSVSNVMRISWLRWFGHVERMPAEDWISLCRVWLSMELEDDAETERRAVSV